MMEQSRPRRDRLPIGQLLVRMLSEFRAELLAGIVAAGLEEARLRHLQVFGNIGAEGVRLTDLAARAAMTKPSMAQLVDELETNGYVQRRPDPTDGRAKLISLTDEGWKAIRLARSVVTDIERDYAGRIGARRFEELCRAMQDLLNALKSDR